MLLAPWPNSASAQFRYLLSTDLHEQYNSDVFAGVSNPDWDFITELEPGFRAYFNQPSSLFWLSYAFTLQLFARTEDRGTGDKLLGYGNRLQLEYTKLFSLNTGLRLYNRFYQGTENTQVRAGVDATGSIETGFLSTGTKYFADAARLELQRLWTSRWASRWRLDFATFIAYDRLSGFIRAVPIPNSWEIASSHRLEYLLPNDILRLDTSFTALIEQRQDLLFPDYPTMATLYFDLVQGWRHYFNPFWDCTLSVGLDLRARQVYDPGRGQTTFQAGMGPLGSAAIRYRLGPRFTAAFEYTHGYQLTFDVGTTAVADADQFALGAEWTIQDWLLEGYGSFRYLRTTSREPGALTGTIKVVTAGASVAYVISPGFSVDAGYGFELVRDRPVPSYSGQPLLLPPDYDRHLAMVGVSVVWPAQPPQDGRLTRRASANEPIFTFTPDGTGSWQRPDREDDSLMQMRRRRLRQEQDEAQERDRGTPEVDLAEPGQPRPDPLDVEVP